MSQSSLMLACVLAGLVVSNGGQAASSGSVARTAAWSPLEEMTAQERANAELHLCLGPSASRSACGEAETIETLWNSGRCDKALARLRDDQSGIAGACLLAGVNWRVPRPNISGTDWGWDQRISDRDSIFRFVYGQCAASSDRLLGVLRQAGDRCYLDVSRFIGDAFSETFNGWFQWHPRDLAGVGCGSHFYLGYMTVDQSQALAIRFSAATGSFVPFHSGCWFDTLLAVTAQDDSITGIAMCASDNGANQTGYAFGSTKQRNLLGARADSFGQPWTPIPTGVSVCDGGVNCAYNVHCSSHNPVLVCWLYRPNPDTQFVATGFLDDTLGDFHPSYRRDVASRPYFHSAPGIAAWRDTVIVPFARYDFSGPDHDTRFLWSGDAGRNWTSSELPGANQSNPDVTGDDSEGFAVAQCASSGVTFTHSDYRAQDWTPDIGISDYAPDSTQRPRVAASDGDDVFYLAGQSGTAGTVWWNNSNWVRTGLGQQKSPPGPVPSLRATATHGRIVATFQSHRAQRIRLAVFDAAGRMIHEQSERRGDGAQRLECTTTSSGLVFIRLEVDGLTAKAKLAVLR